EAQPRHLLYGILELAQQEPVAFDVVGAPFHEGIEELLDLPEIHLVVAPHHYHDVMLVAAGLMVSGDDGTARSLIGLVPEQRNARVLLRALEDHLVLAIRAAVVDDVDLRQDLRQVLERLPDELFLLVGGDHQGDALSPVGALRRGVAQLQRPHLITSPRQRATYRTSASSISG